MEFDLGEAKLQIFCGIPSLVFSKLLWKAVVSDNQLVRTRKDTTMFDAYFVLEADNFFINQQQCASQQVEFVLCLKFNKYQYVQHLGFGSETF